jgi:hypothetical protein
MGMRNTNVLALVMSIVMASLLTIIGWRLRATKPKPA